MFLAGGKEVGQIKGDWVGWNFKFFSGESELGQITKTGNGLPKEFLTIAKNYKVIISGETDKNLSILLLAGVLPINTLL